MEGAQQGDAVRHVYRLKGMHRDLTVLLGVVFALDGVGLAALKILQNADNLVSYLILSTSLVAVGAYLLSVALCSFMAIEGTRIEIRGGRLKSKLRLRLPQACTLRRMWVTLSASTGAEAA
jgi:hypothetical protein